MQKPDSLKLYLNFRKYETPLKFKGLVDVDDEIYSQLIYNPNHEYHVKSKVSEETFSSFLEYWISGKEPLITHINLFEYVQLSEEFKIMNEVIQKTKNNFDACEQNLYKLKHLNNIDKKSIEQTISSNLDLYIEKQGENLMSLDIQTLYNIFSQSNENFSKHNKAYELIKKHYEKYKDDTIFILLPILESEKLTYSNFKEIFNESETRFGFLPKKVISFFEEQSKKIEELSKLLQQSQTELRQTKEELEQAKKEIGGYKDIISQQKGEIDRLEQENTKKDEKIGQIESLLIEKGNEIGQKLEELKTKTREYDLLQKQFDEKIEEVKKQNNLLTTKDEEIVKLRSEIKERNQEKASMQTTINNKISEISRLENIINDKGREIKSLQTKVESEQNECKRLNKYIDDETVHIYNKGDYSKITKINSSSDQNMAGYKKNYAMEITLKSFKMHYNNSDRAKYVKEQLDAKYGGKWCVFINVQSYGNYYITFYENCHLIFSIGEYEVTVFKSSDNC